MSNQPLETYTKVYISRFIPNLKMYVVTFRYETFEAAETDYLLNGNTIPHPLVRGLHEAKKTQFPYWSWDAWTIYPHKR
jgi:hypothetical protein